MKISLLFILVLQRESNIQNLATQNLIDMLKYSNVMSVSKTAAFVNCFCPFVFLCISTVAMHYFCIITAGLLSEAVDEFISVINQLNAQNFCFRTERLFHASTCFEHMCSKHVEA